MRLWQRIVGTITGTRPALRQRDVTELFTLWNDNTERTLTSFETYVSEGYAGNGVVFAAVLARMMLFSEARYAWLNRDTEQLTGGGDLDVLRFPEPGMTGRMMRARRILDVDTAGDSFLYRAGRDRLVRWRPDWVGIVRAPDEPRPLSYIHVEGGLLSGGRMTVGFPNEVSHFAPVPAGNKYLRGMSWLMPVAREVDADLSMTKHRGKFFDNAATPALVIMTTAQLETDQRRLLEERLKERYEGTGNAYRTMILEGGGDVKPVGNTFEQIAFSTTQAAGENRIVIASGVPAVVLGIKEGLQSATYSNYQQAMRRFADLTMRPLWGGDAESLDPIVTAPPESSLWYDVRHVAALQQDRKDDAETMRLQALAAAALIRVGYVPDEVMPNVIAGTLEKIGHTGGIPVTLYPDGEADDASPNGQSGSAVTAKTT